jgi:hypothetical protein
MKKQLLVLALSSISASVFATPPTTPTPVLPFGAKYPSPDFTISGAGNYATFSGTPTASNAAKSISGLNNQLNQLGWAFGYGVSGTNNSGDDFLAASKKLINNLKISSPVVGSDFVLPVGNYDKVTQGIVYSLGVDADAYQKNLDSYKTAASAYANNAILLGSNGVNALSNLIGYGDVQTTWSVANGFQKKDNVPATTLQSAVTGWNDAAKAVSIDSTYHQLTGLNTLATAAGSLVNVSSQVVNFGQNLQTATQQYSAFGTQMLKNIDANSYANLAKVYPNLVSALPNTVQFVGQ